jgi:arylformamidase
MRAGNCPLRSDVQLSMTRVAACALVSITLLTSAEQSAGAVERDLAYGADPAQRLDLSVPAGKGFPTVIFVHGGSLAGGDKADADYGKVCDAFPAAGIACANVNYRLLPAAPWPAPAEDVAAAVAWLHDKLPARGGDPHKIFLLGHSSGAMLVALVGSDERFLKQKNLGTSALSGVMPMGSIMWDDDLRQSIARDGRDKVEAAFARDPRGKAFGSLDAYQAQWPINYVRAGLPPFFFLIAESEQVNPPVLRTDQQFVDDARAKGSAAELKVFAGRTHYSNIRRIHEPGDEVFAAVVGFVHKH